MFSNPRDLIGGGIIGVFGLVGLVEGNRLGAGTLAEIGPGFFPMVLGTLLVLLGLLMARGSAGAAPAPALQRPQWRGWSCIILGVVAFIVLGPYAGLVPATLACVFISALGDRQATVTGSLLLAVGTTLFGLVLFHFLLRINIPLFGSGS
jgi:hypothetical protein